MSFSDSLIAFWELEEASGARADSSPSGNHLTDHNGVTSFTGIVGNAASFLRSSSQFLSCASNAGLSMGDTDFWLNFWVDVGTPSGTAVILNKSNGTDYEFQTYFKTSNGRMQFYVEGPSSSIDLAGDVLAGGWHMISCWHDSVNNTVTIVTDDGTPISSSYSGGARSTAHNFTMGADNGGSAAWEGELDQVGIWKRIPAAGEITALYNAGAGLPYSSMVVGAPPASTIITSQNRILIPGGRRTQYIQM